MKLLLALFVISATNAYASQASCEKTASEVNNENLFATVYAPDHMTIEFSLVLKKSKAYSTVLLGGVSYDQAKTNLNCPTFLEDAKALTYEQRVLNENYSAGSDYLKANYKVCLYDYKKTDLGTFAYKLDKVYEICNEVSGD